MLVKIYIKLVYVWLAFALSFDAVRIYQHFYPSLDVSVLPVENKIAMGKFAGSRNVAFGVKNIIEEYLQEANYSVTEDAPTKIKVELLYMDVIKTQTNLSVFHRNSDAVVIRMRGQIIQDDRVKKTVVVEESAEEVFIGTVVIDEGGKFNNENLSSALKKCSSTLIDKLIK